MFLFYILLFILIYSLSENMTLVILTNHPNTHLKDPNETFFDPHYHFHNRKVQLHHQTEQQCFLMSCMNQGLSTMSASILALQNNKWCAAFWGENMNNAVIRSAWFHPRD